MVVYRRCFAIMSGLTVVKGMKMRKALLLILTLSLLVLLPAACGPGGEASQSSSINTSKLKALSKKEKAALENKLIIETVATNPDSLGNGRIVGRVVNLSNKDIAAVDVAALAGEVAKDSRVVGKTTVGPVAKQREAAFSITTAVPINQLSREGVTLKADKVMVDR
jgi:hypothetical protein